MNTSSCLEHCIAALNESTDSTSVDGGDVRSLLWLWRTVGATCCWALSDVICDACIRSTPSGAKKKVDPPLVPDHSLSTEPSCRTGTQVPNREVPTHGVSVEAQQLTPEQNALISGFVSLLVVAIGLLGIDGVFSSRGGDRVAPLELVGPFLGGCVHFSAYLLTLRAFSSSSSTVITPLMQLSAVWMLPFSSMAALMGFATMIRPVHLCSVLLICAGGFLPAADGSLSLIASRQFWKQRTVRYVILAELLVCFYNIILHQATFNASSEPGNGDHDAGIRHVLRFFLVSRAANSLTCAAIFGSVPSLRRHATGLLRVSPRFLTAAFLGECLSLAGVGLVTFSYSSFYEPSVVNAAEGGLQQLFNLLFALASHNLLGWGRAVDQVNVKCVSFALVAMGLMLSTL